MMRRKLLILLAVGILACAGLIIGTRLLQGPETPQAESDLRFADVSPTWNHETNLDSALPFMAAALLDMDGDGIDEIFIGGGLGQADAVFKYSDGRFELSRRSQDFGDAAQDATYGAASLDVTGDGRTDLFVAREQGLWFYENREEGFVGRLIDLDIAENTAPVSIAIGDINSDGWADLYISGYIKLAYVEGETIFNKDYGGYSYLLANNGDNTWSDVSQDWGVWRQHNTFTASFLDLDQDHDDDLVIAQDTGRVEIYENRDGHYHPLPPEADFSYPMGLGFGDYDNDGDIDLYFSNVGRTLPIPLLRGDLRDDQELNPNFILLRNEGSLQFTDQAEATATAHQGFGWGVVMQDMNLDGRQDILIAQNYARFPGVKLLALYNGRLLRQDENGQFAPIEEVTGAANPNFAMAPLVSDFDGNGYPDLVWANLTGPLRVLMSEGGENHFLAVRLPNEVGSLSATVRVELADGKLRTDQFATSEGLGSDQSHTMLFGLGLESTVRQVTVDWRDGSQSVIASPEVDTILTVSRKGTGE